MTTSVGSIVPPGPLSYTGAIVVPSILRTFDPETTFNTFSVPTIWINTASGNAFILVSKALGIANWILIGGASGTVAQITTPDAVVVVPTAGNINFLETGAITITGSGSDITFDVTGSGLTWVEVAGITQQMDPDTGYITANGSLTTLTLPVTCAQGSIIIVTGKGNGGWSIAQNADQQIFFGEVETTVGVAGSLASTLPRDTVTLVCITEDLEFQVLSSIGNITYV